MSRTIAREIAYRVLFSENFSKLDSIKEAIINALDGQVISNEDLNFIESTVNGVITHEAELKEIIKQNTTKFALDRVVLTDLTALLLATYELKYTDTPHKVIINEAINLVKKFSSEKSYSFVNSVLRKISQGSSNE